MSARGPPPLDAKCARPRRPYAFLLKTALGLWGSVQGAGPVPMWPVGPEGSARAAVRAVVPI